jgi:acyl-CoA thioesterase FadM
MEQGTDGHQWWYTQAMPAPDEGAGRGFHVSNHGIARVLFDTRNRYFSELPVEGGIWYAPVTPLIREITLRYESEVMSGAPVVGAVAVTSRSRRSFVMTESITEVSDPGSPRLVAAGHSVHVTVDTAARAAVEIPDWLLTVLEDFQGGPIPPRT